MNPTTDSPNSSGPRQMLAPAAYSEAVLPSLRLARLSRFALSVGRLLSMLLVVSCIGAVFLPWQQSVKGTGWVMAYKPEARQQSIESPIKGRLLRLGPGIFENARVSKGDTIAELTDVDPDYFRRLQEQLDAANAVLVAAEDLLKANERNRDTAREVVTSNEDQLRAYRQVKDLVVASADAMVEAGVDKVEARQQELAQERAALAQLKADYERQRRLISKDYVSTDKFQQAERKYGEAQAKVKKAQAYLNQAKNELVSKRNDRQAYEQKAQVDIDYATAAVRKAEASVAKAESEVAKAEADVSKAQKSVLEAEAKVARQNQVITAPFDGFLTRIIPNQASKILKQGDTLCEIVPDTKDRAVQIWLSGNDAALVEAGRHVRLQFEGWPAIQWTGWPSAAVGTFGGTVASVDAIDNGKGKFRVLVLPDESSRAWPKGRFLRQGVRANGWVLLKRVPLWFEIWRNMNGFPPVVDKPDESKPAKPPKLPKS